MMLILETPEEEAAIRQRTITASQLGDKIKVNDLNPEITVGVNTKLISNQD